MKNKNYLKIPFFVFILLIAIPLLSFGQAFYNVKDFGARSDSSVLCTVAIQKAINKAALRGGGTIYFPAGKYLTGPIHLKSHITLYIDAGAELHFSDNFNDYLPMVASRWEGTRVMNYSPLIYADSADHIAIEGHGILDGHGKKWWDYSEGYDDHRPKAAQEVLFKKLNPHLLLPEDPKWLNRGFLRPPFIQFMHCSNILIDGVTLRNAPFWTINPEFSDNVTITRVMIDNPPSPNTDGINPESCRYVHIANCHISVGDDCITIKSGKDRDGRDADAPAEDYTIENCTMLRGHGGVVIGSEMSGSVKRITISNCVFDGTDRGIRIKTARGRGGVVEDIRVSNIVMHKIGREAIVLDMQYARTGPRAVDETTPIFRNIHFNGITGSANIAGSVNGLEEMPSTALSFTDIVLEASTGFKIMHVKDAVFRGISLEVKTGSSMQFDDCSDIEVEGLRSHQAQGSPVFSCHDVSGMFIHGCRPLGASTVFLDVSGAKTADFKIEGNDLDVSKTPLHVASDVKTTITSF